MRFKRRGGKKFLRKSRSRGRFKKRRGNGARRSRVGIRM